MLAVLRAKFAPGSTWAQLLCETGDAYLLKHNSVRGRDHLWSNNNVGDGRNWLGLQLMLIREQLRLQTCTPWTDFASRLIDIETGQPHNATCRDEWHNVVLSATKALVAAIDSKHRMSLARTSMHHSGRQTDGCETQFSDAKTAASRGTGAWHSWRPLSARRNSRASSVLTGSSKLPGSVSACQQRKNVQSHDGWETHVDPFSGTTFYHHRRSGRSSWDPPPCDGADQSRGHVAPSPKAGGEVVEEQPAESGEHFVDEWRKATDPSGNVYYWCVRTRETRWDPPC